MRKISNFQVVLQVLERFLSKPAATKFLCLQKFTAESGHEKWSKVTPE